MEQSAEKPSNEKEIDWQDAYYQSFPKIFHFFCYKVGDPILAEELTAITFEKGWRSRGNFRKGANVHAWLVGIARHVASDHFRKKSREIYLEEMSDSDPFLSHYDEDFHHKEDFQNLCKVLNQFPIRERELIYLKYGAELTHREIARMTCLSVSNVGTIIHRVVEKLRVEWEKQNE